MVIGFFSQVAGANTSLLVASLAAALVELRFRVTVVDLGSGAAERLTSISGPRLPDATDTRSTDDPRIALRSSSIEGCFLLPCSPGSQTRGGLSSELLRRVLDVAAEGRDVVLVDLGCTEVPATVAAIPQLELAFNVVATDRRSRFLDRKPLPHEIWSNVVGYIPVVKGGAVTHALKWIPTRIPRTMLLPDLRRFNPALSSVGALPHIPVKDYSDSAILVGQSVVRFAPKSAEADGMRALILALQRSRHLPECRSSKDSTHWLRPRFSGLPAGRPSPANRDRAHHANASWSARPRVIGGVRVRV